MVTIPIRNAVVDPINRFMSIKNVLTQWSKRRRRYKKRKWVALRLDKAIKPPGVTPELKQTVAVTGF